MATVLMFHHAHGVTAGIAALAERLRANGHTVYVPDTYAGHVFSSVDEGLAFAQHIGHDAAIDVAFRAARTHPDADVVVGFSLGAMQAQALAQSRRKIRACALVGAAIPPECLGGPWRTKVALQLHAAQPDEWVLEEEIEGLVRHAPASEVFRYKDKGHLFMDVSSRDYDADAADLFEERLTDWLATLDPPDSPA